MKVLKVNGHFNAMPCSGSTYSVETEDGRIITATYKTDFTTTHFSESYGSSMRSYWVDLNGQEITVKAYFLLIPSHVEITDL